MSQPQIPAISSEFLTVESFKEATQQSVKAAGFAFSVSSSKMFHVGKVNRTPFVTLQCTMGDIINECGRIRNALNKGSNHDTTPVCSSSYIIKRWPYAKFVLYTLKLCVKWLYLPFINAVGISNIGNAKVLNTYQIAIAWIVNEQEYTYKWFLFTLKETIYDTFFCSPEVFFFDSNKNYDKFLLLVQQVAKEISTVKKAFNEKKDAKDWDSINAANREKPQWFEEDNKDSKRLRTGVFTH
ncbi:hypothetical protein G9A89_009016 [Geosiphon pyriformis]|nr:hypothetical protein G9A89_009016 [Geosiphon pyriformis]